ncbi:MAG TPA: hypothetical protein VFI61_01645, partial [Patescibacteria group bacterium]|nr:hypothetical protein [Patescibacteria group bacterium]
MNKKLFSILGIIALFAMAFGFAFTPNNVVANASHGKAMTAGCTTYTRNISGDSDSGFGGYWASDTYVSSYEVCPDSEDGYWVNRTDGGDWETFGGTSPSGASTVGAGVTGTFEGTWNGIHIDGTIMALSTDLGTVDFMCDANGVCSNKSSTLAQIFNPGYVADFPDTWIWTYTGGCQGDLWINAASGSSGDIT